ncbi:D-2-hydroxyacid dehydrogenase [Frigidibacter sp. MR17.14]|uniref:D-2-hydroxyacid dehydrogenase n=1 Tax=Frigidibacter sp. MR17.14 TaxID=3126509 RepID=UPI003012F885
MSMMDVVMLTDAGETARAIVEREAPGTTVHLCDRYDALEGLLAATAAPVVYATKFAGGAGFPRAALMAAPALRWISVGGSGTDHLAPWDPSRLTVTNAAGVSAGMMAEYVIGMMLSFSLDLAGHARRQAARDWAPAKVAPVAGRRMLILGLGATGIAVAVRAKAMGMTVAGLRARPVPTPPLDEVHGIDALTAELARADVLVCCLPLTDATRGMIDAAALAALPRGAILIDLSRGGVVDEPALLQALNDGHLAGAARDVFTTEPLPPEHPLWQAPNLRITPHCSAVWDGWEEAAIAMFARNLRRWRANEPLANVVDPARGY